MTSSSNYYETPIIIHIWCFIINEFNIMHENITLLCGKQSSIYLQHKRYHLLNFWLLFKSRNINWKLSRLGYLISIRMLSEIKYPAVITNWPDGHAHVVALITDKYWLQRTHLR